MIHLLSVAVESLRNHSFDWLLAATLLPSIYLLTQKRKQGWLKKIVLKWLMKRAQKRTANKKEMSKGLIILLAILLTIGLALLAAAWLGWGGLLAVLVVFFLAFSAYKR